MLVNKYRKAFLLVVMLFVYGCTHAPSQPTPPEVHYVLVKPSYDLLKDCDVGNPPPDKNNYINSSIADRERMLHDYASFQQLAMGKCNTRWSVLRDWYTNQSKNYTDVK
jgi:hypothetical protein